MESFFFFITQLKLSYLLSLGMYFTPFRNFSVQHDTHQKQKKRQQHVYHFSFPLPILSTAKQYVLGEKTLLFWYRLINSICKEDKAIVRTGKHMDLTRLQHSLTQIKEKM